MTKSSTQQILIGAISPAAAGSLYQQIRLQPLLLNYHAGGATWRNHDVRRHQVVARNRHIEEGSPALWAYASDLIDRAEAEGKLDE